MVNYFASFDNAICDFKVEEVQREIEKSPISVTRLTHSHKMVDCDEFESIPLKSESSGTLKMFALYPSLKEVLDNGGTLFVDELNARLHPLLVRNIILTFCLRKLIPIMHR
ncbi:MAG: AAA family ATPase [Enterocloster sp.]